MEYIQTGKRKIKVKVLTSFKDRIKSFRFYLEPITTGICFPKKKGINTYFFCQRVDIIMTDENRKILYLYPNVKSEKIFFYKRKVKKIYLLPVGVTSFYKIGDVLKVEEK